MLELLIVAVMAFHLLAMNLASAGPLVCVWLRRCGKTSEDLGDRLGRTLAWLSLAAFVLGMLSGGALVLVPSSTDLLDAIRRFPSRAYHMAGIELLFSLLLLWVYAACWKPLRKRPWLHAFIALLGATNLLYHFPTLMVVLGKLSVDKSWAQAALIDRPAFLELMARGEVLSLTAHFVLASISVAAVAVLWLLTRGSDEQLDKPEATKIARGSAIIAVASSGLQLAVGVWVLSSVSGAERNALMGGDLLTSLFFACGLLATFLLLQRLTATVLGNVERKHLRRTGWLLVAIVLLMTATLRTARSTIPLERVAQTCSQESMVSLPFFR